LTKLSHRNTNDIWENTTVIWCYLLKRFSFSIKSYVMVCEECRQRVHNGSKWLHARHL